MEISFKNENWKKALSFSQALEPFLKPQVKIAVAGSGGKTSVIMRIAEEQRTLGKKVLVLTTTHMFKPQKYGVFSGAVSDVRKALDNDKVAICGKLTENGKITWQGDEFYQKTASMADVVLIEADGSKRLPAKFPNASEPVIPSDTDLILAVSGLKALGQKGKDTCHRWELARIALGIENEDEVLNARHLGRLMETGYILPLKDNFTVIPLFNQADDEELKVVGREIIDGVNTDYGIVSSFGITERAL